MKCTLCVLRISSRPSIMVVPTKGFQSLGKPVLIGSGTVGRRSSRDWKQRVTAELAEPKRHGRCLNATRKIGESTDHPKLLRSVTLGAEGKGISFRRGRHEMIPERRRQGRGSRVRLAERETRRPSPSEHRRPPAAWKAIGNRGNGTEHSGSPRHYRHRR